MARLKRFSLSVAALTLAGTACSSEGADPVLDAEEAPDAISVDGIAGDGDLAPLAGTFELVTHFDVSEGELLPDLAGDVLASLTGLAESPSAVLFDVVSDLPVVDTIFDLTPDFLEDTIAGLIDQFVFEQVYNEIPATEGIAQIIDDIATIATDFEVVSRLEIDEPDAMGNAAMDHRLRGIAFSLRGERYEVDLAPAATGLLRARTIAGHYYDQTSGVADGHLFVGDHAFSLPVGALALVGVEEVLETTMGASDLRDALGMLVDCPGMGARVADACIADTCAPLGDAIETLCTSGLDRIVDQIEARLLAIQFNSIHFVGGEAALFDSHGEEAADGSLDAIDDGRWDLIIGRSATATESIAAGTFAGRRLGTCCSEVAAEAYVEGARLTAE